MAFGHTVVLLKKTNVLFSLGKYTNETVTFLHESKFLDIQHTLIDLSCKMPSSAPPFLFL
jgi:hypothetical protein